MLAPQTAIKDAHDLTARLEKHLRAAIPELSRVVIHVEPPEPPDPQVSRQEDILRAIGQDPPCFPSCRAKRPLTFL